MCNLRLLIIDNVHIPNGLNHLSYKLRLLEWRGYSSKCLPSKFQSKELVELKLRFSKIEYLWRGVKVIMFFKLSFYYLSAFIFSSEVSSNTLPLYLSFILSLIKNCSNIYIYIYIYN